MAIHRIAVIQIAHLSPGEDYSAGPGEENTSFGHRRTQRGTSAATRRPGDGRRRDDRDGW
jgi:hypothetical protein